MPNYLYRCTKCDEVFEAFSLVKNRNKKKRCKCGAKAKRDEKAELQSMGRFNETMKELPRWSRALGVNITQLPEARKLWPDWTFNEKGDVLVTSRQDKLQKMKARGMAEVN
jgi:putative FmdB family regulatory protein